MKDKTDKLVSNTNTLIKTMMASVVLILPTFSSEIKTRIISIILLTQQRIFKNEKTVLKGPMLRVKSDQY